MLHVHFANKNMSTSETTVQSIEHITDAHVQVSFLVPEHSVEHEFKKTIQELSKDVRIPGFRKGKTPLAVIERKFTSDISKHVLKTLIADAAQSVFSPDGPEDIRKNQPISEPSLTKEPSLTRGSDFEFSLEYDIIPDISLPNLSDVEAESAEISVSDDDITEDLRALQERNADVRTKENETVALGDVVTLDYVELDDNKEEIPSTNRKGYTCTAGSDQLDLGPGIIGLKQNETKTMSIGPKKATRLARIHITNVSEKSLPELNDEFAQDVDDAFKTLADLKESFKQKKGEQADTLAQQYLSSNVFEVLLSACTCALPESLVQSEFSKHANQHIRSRFPDNPQEALDSGKITLEELHTTLDPIVEKSVKTHIILLTLSKDHDLDVSDDDVRTQIQTLHGDTQLTDEMIQKYKQMGFYNQIKSNLLEKKLSETISNAVTPISTKKFDSINSFLTNSENKPKNELKEDA